MRPLLRIWTSRKERFLLRRSERRRAEIVWVVVCIVATLRVRGHTPEGYPQHRAVGDMLAPASFNDPSCEMGKEIYDECCPVRTGYFTCVDPYFP